MVLADLHTEIPRWAVVALFVAVGVSFAYGIIIMGSLTGPLALWTAGFGVVLSLIVVYLFYRLVLAVETIAEKH